MTGVVQLLLSLLLVGVIPRSPANHHHRPVSAAPSPFVLDGEFPVDTALAWDVDPGDNDFGALATNGSGFFAVWMRGDNSDWQIDGTRLDRFGRVQDSAGILIARVGEYYPPTVVFDGENYVVFWIDYDTVGRTVAVLGARVTPAGVVLDVPAFVVSGRNEVQRPMIASGSNGTNSLVAWSTGGHTNRLFAARVDRSGVVLDTAGIEIPDTTGDLVCPAIAFDGANYFVAWKHTDGGIGTAICGIHMSPEGIILDSSHITIPASPDYDFNPLSVAYDGTNYFAVWTDLRNSDSGDLYGARVSRDGRVLDSGGFAISRAANAQEWSSTVFDGTDFMVIWQDGRISDRDIYAARVSSEGAVLDTEGIVVNARSYYQYHPVLVRGAGDSVLAVWTDCGDSAWQLGLCATFLSSSGQVLDTIPSVLNFAPSNRSCPAIASDGANYLVAWQDSRAAGSTVCALRVGPNGSQLDPTGIDLTRGRHSETRPAAAFGNSCYLVVGCGLDSLNRKILVGSRISPENGLPDTCEIRIYSSSNNLRYPAVAFDGSSFLVTWDEYPLEDRYALLGTRVAPDGAKLDTQPIRFGLGDSDNSGSSVAAVEGGFLVAWTRDRFRPNIAAARVNSQGVLLDSQSIPVATSESFIGCCVPAVACDGVNSLVVWSGCASREDTSRIWGARVTPDGTVLDSGGFPISPRGFSAHEPAVTFDGRNYVVVWQVLHEDRFDVAIAVVSPDGVVTDTETISTIPLDKTGCAIAHGRAIQTLVVFSMWADSVNHHPARALHIWGKTGGYSGAAELPGSASLRPRLSAFPNPFRGRIQISYQVGAAGPVSLRVFDISGRAVRILDRPTKGPVKAGLHTATWDGRDDDGRSLAEGVYFINLDTPQYHAGCKVIVNR